MKRIKGTSLEDGVLHEQHHSCSRRDFLSKLGLFAVGSSFMLNSTPVRALQSNSLFRKLARLDSNRVLVLVQLKGGNDGLNTIIPIEDDRYYNARPSISIRKGDAVGLTDTLGMHPAMEPLQALWGDGKMGIVQNVGYPDPILSHFSSADVWYTGSDSDNIGTTGWIGRFLDGDYVEQELTDPLDYPLAINVGGSSSLLFSGPDNNTAFNLRDLGALRNIADQGQLYSTNNLPDTAYGNEMRFLREQINDSFQYADSISNAYNDGNNQVDYEARQISMDLEVVARLIKGGLGSKIYMVSIDGFDTHTNQPSAHQENLMLLSNAIRSFYDDLAAGGASEEVLVMTFSEFGRRVEQNGQGTDHGTAAPVMVFGDGITPGVFGHNPKLSRSDLDENGNLIYQFDFRSVYTTILTDWFGIPESEAAEVLANGSAYPKLGFLGSQIVSNEEDPNGVPARFQLQQNYPNPFNPTTNITFTIPSASRVQLTVYDIQGRKIAEIANRNFTGGQHTLAFDASGLASGVYLYRIQAGRFSETRKMTLIK